MQQINIAHLFCRILFIFSIKKYLQAKNEFLCDAHECHSDNTGKEK